MTACVFVGPTLSVEDVLATCAARCLPPVSQGDVYRAVMEYRPRAIGVIDGYFGGAASVWHKEILWALSQGVDVLGCSSMGALRAAELHPFGMRGIGRIFEAYRDGVIEDDDEVAILHAPAELGFASLSEPMVNIRETLSRAAAEGILSPTTRLFLERIAKALHFTERRWEIILARGRDASIDPGELMCCERWLPSGRIDLKRSDALAMLEVLREIAETPPSPDPPAVFEPTSFWHALTAREQARTAIAEADRLVLDELILEGGDLLRDIRRGALVRMGATHWAETEGAPEESGDGSAAVDRLRAELSLHARSDLETWLARNGLDTNGFADLAARSARLASFVAAAYPTLHGPMLDELRVRGHYGRLAARAADKQVRLARTDAPGLGQSSRPERLALRLWFIEERVGLSDQRDIADILEELGFADLAHLDRTLHREKLYTKLVTPTGGSDPDARQSAAPT